ncbi:MAG TPA: response regulator [Nitrospiria bacterium]|nr:response regulator [Nitrospiria bacterium]
METANTYCLCCGEQVPVNKVQRDGKLETTCVYCGFVLDVAMEEEKGMIDCIFTADDSELTRQLLKESMIKKKLARSVISAKNGQEFITSFTKRLADKQRVDLVILDLEMPVMDGITAARMMRAIESKYGKAKAPILFFSAHKCDENLKRQMTVFSPASYVNKGSDSNPTKLMERIDLLIGHLLINRESAAS